MKRLQGFLFIVVLAVGAITIGIGIADFILAISGDNPAVLFLAVGICVGCLGWVNARRGERESRVDAAGDNLQTERDKLRASLKDLVEAVEMDPRLLRATDPVYVRAQRASDLLNQIDASHAPSAPSANPPAHKP